MSPYTQEINRQQKACFLFLLDQSTSMEDSFAGTQERKCDALATAINKWLHTMVLRAAQGGSLKNWFDIGVIGYHTDEQGTPIVQSALSAALAGKELVTVEELDGCARREMRQQKIVDEETGGQIENETEFLVWIDPLAHNGTPMCHALMKAHEILSGWVAEHSKSYPPIVIHITDGESADGDPREWAAAVRDLQTDDGNVLLFNCHISDQAADPFLFVSSPEMLPDQYARQLFEMSSVIPDAMRQYADTLGFQLETGARGFVFNADSAVLLGFLDIGTRSAGTLR